MLKHICLLLALFVSACCWAQYNPSNPPEPTTPATTYKLVVEKLPANGGSTSPSSGKYAAGAKVSLSASPSNGFIFEKWEDVQGKLLSTSRQMTYTMPEADVKIYARFKYSPSNPEEPTPAPVYKTVNLKADPAGAGYLSGGGKYAVGTNVRIDASANTSYRFLKWTIGEEVVSTSPNFYYVVREDDNNLTARFEYSPSNPDEPVTPAITHKLRVAISPEGSGSLSTVSGRYSEGSNVYLSVSPYTGYKLVSWTDSEGNTLSNSTGFYFTMPGNDVSITANLVYNPDSPTDPGTVAPRRNVIYGSRQSVSPAAKIFYGIALENIDQISGISIDITMPEGFVADYDHAVLTSRAAAHSISSQEVDATTRRVFVRGNEPLSGGSGIVFKIPVTIPADAEPGSSTTVKLSKGVIFTADGSQSVGEAADGILKIAETPITLPDSPDFRISDVKATAREVMPGDIIDISWKVTNRGKLDATAGWSETVWLVDENGNRTAIESVYYSTDRLGVNEAVSRSASFTIPAFPGTDGKLNAMVTLTPDPSAGEIEAYQVNNSATSEGFPITLGKCLTLEIPASLTEGTDKSVRCRILRSGNRHDSETFQLEKVTADKRIHIPESVLIPKNQSGAYFMLTMADNDLLDENGIFAIKASGNGYTAANASVEIIDDEFPEIELSLPKEQITEEDTVAMTVTLPRAPQSALEVSLGCDAPARFSMPASVTIPAGEVSAVVEVTAVDNDKIENTLDVTFTATAPHYGSGEAYIFLEDNDMPLLEVEITPEEVSEGAGPRAIRGVLRRKTNSSQRVIVNLYDDRPGTLIYDSRLTLEKGVEEIDFNIGVIDNARVDGERTVTFTAAVFVQGCSCSATTESGGSVDRTIRIIDNDGPSLSLAASSATLRRDSRNTTLTVSRNTSAVQALTVSLAADTEGLLDLPGSVVIPAGATETTVAVEALESAFTGVEKTLVINATAEGFAKGLTMLLISDRTLPDAVVALTADTSSDYIPESPVTLTARVTNEGNTTMPDAVPVDIYFAGKSEAAAYAHTTRALAPGESEELALEVKLPAIPGRYDICAHVNDANNFKELTRTNNVSGTLSFNVKSPFSATVDTDRKILMPGEKVTLGGMAPGYGKELEVYYITKGARRTASVTPDGTGRFSVEIDPAYPGDYIAGVCIPGEGKTEEMTAFAVRGFQIANDGYLAFDVEAGASKTLTIRLTNNTSEPLTGLTVEAEGTPEGCGFSVENEATIPGNATVNVNVTLTGLATTDGLDWEQFRLKMSTNEGPSAYRTIYFYCRPNKARLVSSVSSINTTMTVGEQRIYRLTIGNNGSGNTGDITLSLPTFMQKGTATTLPSIASGKTADIDLVLSSSPEMQLNVPVTGKIGINCANGDGLSIPFSVEPVSDKTGRLIVDVKDEYTFYTAEAPHVEGADVMVSHPVTGKMIAHGKTDANGLWETTLPEGFYTLEVSANRHGVSKETIQIDPGVDNEHPVFIPFEAITYGWKVEETTVDDTYDIVTTVDYETRVPKPVVVVDFPKISYRNQIVYFSITNKGLLSARNVTVLVPAPNEHVQMEVIGDNVIPELRAGENRMVPVRVSVDQEGAYPDFTMTVDSYSFTGDVEEDESRMNVPARAGSSSGCVTLPCKVAIDNYECDPLTGEPIYDGTKKYVDGTYRTGDCGHPGSWPPGSSWSGPGGWGGFGGGPGKPSHNTNNEKVSTYWQDRLRTFLITGCASDCEKALANAIKACYDAIASCTGNEWASTKWIDAYKCGKSVYDSCSPSQINDYHDSVSCGGSVAGCVPKLGCPASLAECINRAYKAFKECMELYRHRKNTGDLAPSIRKAGATANDEEDAILDAKEKRAETVALYTEYYGLIQSNLRNILGEGAWDRLSGDELQNMLSYVRDHCDEEGYIAVDETSLEGKPESVDHETYQNFLERHNNSIRHDITGEVSDNMANPDIFTQNAQRAKEIEARAQEMGYPDFKAFVTTAVDNLNYLYKLSEEPSEGVCASITLKFSQTMVMTRQAFRGTLTVTNGNDEVAMTDLKLNVKVRDSEGNQVGEREFAISAESLDGFEGENALGASWKLAAGATGEATILFIPSRHAAPVEPLVYSFGGVLSYVDPFTGTEMTRELSPIDMTVSPSPLLDLDYFMQRDIIADDPLTEDVIESAEPAEFALLINNKGFGDANNLRMTTNQPEIVDNRKGLAINFEIIGSSLNGSPATVAIGEKIPTEFGTLKSRQTAYAQWWLKSSLMGHFTSYDVKATQVSAYGSEDMSLLDHVEIHELIHGMTPENEEAGTRAFLANDIEDGDNTPDMLWFSTSAEAIEVGSPSSATLTDITDTSCILTVNGSGGWCYGNMAAPWDKVRRIVGVTRLSDGKELPADNVWNTSVTMRNSVAPKHEEKIHFAVCLNGASERYKLTLEPCPEIELRVVSFDGVPEEGVIKTSPVTKVTVSFNKAVDSSTFNAEDITVTCQGKQIATTGISVTPASAGEPCSDFILDLSNITKESGYYTLMVDAAGVTDTEGFKGSQAKLTSWIQLADGKVAVTALAVPDAGGTVSPATSRVNYGEEMTLTAEAAEGYEFTKWTIGVNTASDKASFSFRPIEDTELSAHFSLRNYNVELVCDANQGSVTGHGSGIYPHGSELSFTAIPAPGYQFVSWLDNEDMKLGEKTRLDISLKKDMLIKAVFKKDDSGIDNVGEDIDVKIYPVPTYDRLFITGNFSSIKRIAIIDIKGVRVKLIQGYSKGTPIDVSSLSAGVYFVETTTEKGRYTHRIVKL